MPVATTTKYALAEALKKMMGVKPIDKITVKDLVEICGVNRQTFYYHFDDVYDLLEWIFEEDADKILPKKLVYENWQDDVIRFRDHLKADSTYVINVYNSNRRLHMLNYIKSRALTYVRGLAEMRAGGINVDRKDYEFVVEFCADGVVALTSRWLDKGMELPEGMDEERLLKLLDKSIETLLRRFQN